MSASRNALIAAYRAAYTAANGYPAPEVNYENGWYSIGSGILKVKWRERQVIAATDRLLARSSIVPALANGENHDKA